MAVSTAATTIVVVSGVFTLVLVVLLVMIFVNIDNSKIPTLTTTLENMTTNSYSSSATSFRESTIYVGDTDPITQVCNAISESSSAAAQAINLRGILTKSILDASKSIVDNKLLNTLVETNYVHMRKNVERSLVNVAGGKIVLNEPFEVSIPVSGQINTIVTAIISVKDVNVPVTVHGTLRMVRLNTNGSKTNVWTVLKPNTTVSQNLSEYAFIDFTSHAAGQLLRLEYDDDAAGPFSLPQPVNLTISAYVFHD
jgi:hypothetical protein